MINLLIKLLFYSHDKSSNKRTLYYNHDKFINKITLFYNHDNLLIKSHYSINMIIYY